MADEQRLCGEDLLEVLNTSRNPLKLGGIRNEAIQYLADNADKLPESKCQACKDYVRNFNSHKHMSDQLRDLAVMVNEVNAYLDEMEGPAE